MDLLRFATAGSVDDGKSTLIGRLLLDAKAIFEKGMLAAEAREAARKAAVFLAGELLTGSLPFTGSFLVQLAAKMTSRPPAFRETRRRSARSSTGIASPVTTSG